MKSLNISDDTKINSNIKFLVWVGGGLFAVAVWVTTMEFRVSEVSEDQESAKKVDEFHETKIQQGEIMIYELKQQTQLMQKAVDKLDDRVFKQNSYRGKNK